MRHVGSPQRHLGVRPEMRGLLACIGLSARLVALCYYRLNWDNTFRRNLVR
jgi:hypothetical protein